MIYSSLLEMDIDDRVYDKAILSISKHSSSEPDSITKTVNAMRVAVMEYCEENDIQYRDRRVIKKV